MKSRKRIQGYWRAPICAGAALALMSSTAMAASLVKDCGKDGKYIIGFSQANNAEPYRQHVNDELTAQARELWRSKRSGIYEIVVSNQRGESIALFRGRSHSTGGQIVPAVTA